MRDVHKSPQLDLVGWYTLLPSEGPSEAHVSFHRRILEHYSESALLLGFHPTEVVQNPTSGKLPISIYDSIYEAENPTGSGNGNDGEDKQMTDSMPEARLGMKFAPVTFTIETGEAEMIGVDFVARGGGNAKAIESVLGPGKEIRPHGPPVSSGTQRTESPPARKTKVTTTPEEEELIASLTAKSNAIKMLQTRIDLIATYLRSLPPSLNATDNTSSIADESKFAPVNDSILRSIQALLTRLTLLILADQGTFSEEMNAEQNDVDLVGLLSSITESIKDVRETGRKFHVVDLAKRDKKEGGAGHWEDHGNAINGVGDLIS